MQNSTEFHRIQQSSTEISSRLCQRLQGFSQENQQGGRINKEASIHVSNVMVVDPTTDEPTRIGRKQIVENGKTRWVRYSKKSGELIDK